MNHRTPLVLSRGMFLQVGASKSWCKALGHPCVETSPICFQTKSPISARSILPTTITIYTHTKLYNCLWTHIYIYIYTCIYIYTYYIYTHLYIYIDIHLLPFSDTGDGCPPATCDGRLEWRTGGSLLGILHGSIGIMD